MRRLADFGLLDLAGDEMAVGCTRRLRVILTNVQVALADGRLIVVQV